MTRPQQQQQQEEEEEEEKVLKQQQPPRIIVSPLVVVSKEKDDDDDNKSCNSSSSSVDTEDAFLDMLGLKQYGDDIDPSAPILVMDEEEQPEEEAAAHAEHPPLTAHAIPLPPKCSRYNTTTQPTALTIPNFCTLDECQTILQLAQNPTITGGFTYITEASHIAPDGSTYKVQLQNPNPHKLAVYENPTIIEWLWNRLSAVLFQEQESSTWIKELSCKWSSGQPPIGLNPRLRVLQYDASDNDRFEPHFDATTHVGPHKTSRITVLLYLNSGNGVDFDGGETLFLESHISQYNNPVKKNNNNSTKNDDDNNSDAAKVIRIIPQMGTLVLFEHDLYHSGSPLTWGTKHVMRTDILFQRQPEQPLEQPLEQQTEQVESGTTVSPQQPSAASVVADVTNENGDDDFLKTPAATAPASALLLVKDLCHQQNWSQKEQSILEDMGVLYSTLESLLVPGTKLVTALLMEALGSGDNNKEDERINAFVTAAQQHVQQQQQQQ